MLINPLQALNSKLFDEQSYPALESAEKAENTCKSLYRSLTKRTQQLADTTLTVQFSWRVRVGGVRGFRELLLPVFHPIYGIPYIPSSSLKGAARSWAKKHNVNPSEIERLLGTLNDGIGRVQILDAFPTEPCLSVDMANPQWNWEGNQVKYQPVPHPLLSMEQPEIVIGLVYTSRGKRQANTNDDLETVRTWLLNALASGIGSRVSAGYGRTTVKASLSYSSEHPFQLYSQGMYGATPPNRENHWQGIQEFRPVALRGMLRYWFRAIALGLYAPDLCKQLEKQLFGDLGQEGSIRIGVNLTDETDEQNYPFFCEGEILLEAKSQSHLNLIEKVLILSSHLAGIGRGSRRPLHWNNKRLRGCFWELNNDILPFNEEVWRNFFQEVLNIFQSVQPASNPNNGTPGNSNNRYQDILNPNAQVYLVSCPVLRHPESINNWSNEGYKAPVIGEGLRILYSSDQYKGVNSQRRGNSNVGGRLGIPSFVLIQSNYPTQKSVYQAVTIVGANHPDRNAFIQALPQNYIRVW